MNYTGNPRRFRGNLGPRSTLNGYIRRQGAIPERPQLAICQEFQDRSLDTGTDAKSSLCRSLISSERETFETKRRRLLYQKDWLGLDISVPINIYDIRDAKEQRRRANGPCVRPLFLESSELPATPLPPSSKVPLSPAITSHSSTSLQPQPTVPSIISSRHGSGFIPSHQTTPALTQRKSIPSKSSSPTTSWNPFAVPNTPVSDIKFVPETKFEMEFFPRIMSMDKDMSDMKSVWTLIEEQKREEQHLRIEFGWGSQSGASATQVSLPQQRCRSRQSGEGLSSSHAQLIRNDVDAERSPILSHQDDLMQTKEVGTNTMLQLRKLMSSSQENSSREDLSSVQTPSKAEHVGKIAKTTSFELHHDENTGHANCSNIPGSSFKDMKDEVSGRERLQNQHIDHPTKHLEEEEGDEDEGIPWF